MNYTGGILCVCVCVYWWYDTHVCIIMRMYVYVNYTHHTYQIVLSYDMVLRKALSGLLRVSIAKKAKNAGNDASAHDTHQPPRT